MTPLEGIIVFVVTFMVWVFGIAALESLFEIEEAVKESSAYVIAKLENEDPPWTDIWNPVNDPA